MAEFVEGAHTGEFLMSEAPGTRSRDVIIVAASQTLAVGQVLGKTNGAVLSASSAVFAGNTGNGVMGAITVDAGAQLGDYKVIITEPGANVGNFVVERPDGVMDGQGDVAAAYNGMVNFTLADGATDFVAGDGFTITVVSADREDEEFKALNLAAADGTQIAAGIAYDAVVTGVGETKDAVGITRDAEVNGELIVYPVGATDVQKANIRAQLAELGIIAR